MKKIMCWSPTIFWLPVSENFVLSHKGTRFPWCCIWVLELTEEHWKKLVGQEGTWLTCTVYCKKWSIQKNISLLKYASDSVGLEQNMRIGSSDQELIFFLSNYTHSIGVLDIMIYQNTAPEGWQFPRATAVLHEGWIKPLLLTLHICIWWHSRVE